MKSLKLLCLILTIAASSITNSSAQTISIGGNQYAFQYTNNTNFGFYFNLSNASYDCMSGAAAPVWQCSANTGNIWCDGNITPDGNINPGGSLQVDANEYAFAYSANNNYGLKFSLTNLSYEFETSSGNPIFSIHANSGDLSTTGGLTLGNTAIAIPGTIRWNGSDLEVHDGSQWTSLTQGGSGGGGQWSTDAFGINYQGGNVGVGGPSTELASFYAVGNSGNTIMGVDSSEGGNGVTGVYGGFIDPTDGTGVLGQANRWDWFGFGTIGMGGYAGGRGIVFPDPPASAPLDYYGLQGIVQGAVAFPNTAICIGVYGSATGSFATQTPASFIGDWAVWADGEAYATTAWTASDARYKQNVVELQQGGLETIMQLKPKSYEFTSDGAVRSTPGLQHGFLAQELEQVIPEAVKNTKKPVINPTKENPNAKTETLMDLKVVNHNSLFPFIVKAIQEQQTIIEQKDEQIVALENRLEQVEEILAQLAPGEMSERTSSMSQKAQLGQNFPNPFSNQTTVNFFVPTTAKKAALSITDTFGKHLQSFNVSTTGNRFQTIDASQLPASGNYFYNLVVDGELIATKKLVLIK